PEASRYRRVTTEENVGRGPRPYMRGTTQPDYATRPARAARAGGTIGRGVLPALEDVPDGGGPSAAAAQAQFLVSRGQVALDGANAEHQGRRDLLVGPPLGDQAEDLGLACGEAVRPARRGSSLYL